MSVAAILLLSILPQPVDPVMPVAVVSDSGTMLDYYLVMRSADYSWTPTAEIRSVECLLSKPIKAYDLRASFPPPVWFAGRVRIVEVTEFTGVQLIWIGSTPKNMLLWMVTR